MPKDIENYSKNMGLRCNMCEFCERDIRNERIDIQHWSYKSDLKTGHIVLHPRNGKPCVKIRSSRATRGSFFINYCPICGRKLVEDD